MRDCCVPPTFNEVVVELKLTCYTTFDALTVTAQVAVCAFHLSCYRHGGMFTATAIIKTSCVYSCNSRIVRNISNRFISCILQEQLW